MIVLSVVVILSIVYYNLQTKATNNFFMQNYIKIHTYGKIYVIINIMHFRRRLGNRS